ncbi:MAG TPA: phosphate signaling complex protein PhoU [Candidatus Sumerlaeota bacterium]|nr:phosphate signaling complex protein PhoU [Candidatus Sumerlaeota bacterium]HNM46555.1 phosphate signaling complex protein PhoU [Candidatus Sumerlaeota bacterium]
MPVSGLYLTQVQHLQESVNAMGKLAGELMDDAVKALLNQDAALAAATIERDNELDRLDDEHEEQIVQVIARNQPVARDLRLLVALLRTNTNIERVGDITVNMAQAALRLSGREPLHSRVDIPRTYQLVRAMWNDALTAFLNMDDLGAAQLRSRDDQVDEVNHQTINRLIQISMEEPKSVFQTTNLIGISKSLEKIADQAVDIADEVVYAKRGEFRHARTLGTTA